MSDSIVQFDNPQTYRYRAIRNTNERKQTADLLRRVRADGPIGRAIAKAILLSAKQTSDAMWDI